MDDNMNHGYIQEDMGYDDLMNNAGWPGSGNNQYSYQQQAHPAPDPYSQYHTTTQATTYDHFDLPQQSSYPPVSYSNSPYASQYQSARSSDVFAPASFNVDSSLQGAPNFHENSFTFTPQVTQTATVSPHNLQYDMVSNQSMNRGLSNTPFQQQPSTAMNNFNPMTQEQSAMYFQNSIQSRSILRAPSNPTQYSIIPLGGVESTLKPGIKRPFEDPSLSSSSSSSSGTPPVQLAKLEPASNPLRVTHAELLAAKNSSSRPRFKHAPFIAWEDDPLQIAPGLKNTFPKYHPRKSKSGRELIPGFDLSHTLSPARISTKRSRPTKIKSTLSKYKGTSQGPKSLTGKISTLREDGSIVKSSSTTTESSSSEEESSSSEESEYEEDGEMTYQDINEVRGPTRPTNPAEAARWDVIGIIWKDKNSSPTKDIIKDGIEKYGNYVSALRVQLKSNSTKAEQAAARPAEVAQLRNERRDLLEVLYQTIDAANVFGFDAIVENLGGHQKLVNGLTTTLIECIKTDDFTGKLPKAVFTLLAKFQTMSDELLKKLKFDSIQKRWNRKGDDETKKNIVTILANTTDSKDKAAKIQKSSDEKNAQEEKSKTQSLKAAVSNPAKRAHEGDGTNGKPNKKFASDISGTPSSITKSALPRRSTTNLLGIASKPAAKPVVKKREPSPPQESKLGALLASIAKPPELPKAPVAPPRAPESPEEKARRERKESRRHLRVKFKEGTELEQIRLFKHEQGEDEGRQDDMLRDAHDNHNEGMMHKKRVSETMDETVEEDEYQPPEFEDRQYAEPIDINFTSLGKTTAFGQTYNTRGGDLKISTPEQKTQQRREGLELMVIYTDPKDVPSSAKEPPQTDGAGDVQQELRLREPTEAWLVKRLQEINYYGVEQASQIFLRRQQEQMFEDTRENGTSGIAQPFTPPPSANVSLILQQLGPSQQPSPTPLFQTQNLPNLHISQNSSSIMDSTGATVLTNLEAIVDMVKGKPYPPVEPPDWMTENGRAEWWAGFNKDKAIKEKQEADQRVSQMEAARFQPPPMVQPQFNQQAPTPQMQSYMPPLPQQHVSAQPPITSHQTQNGVSGYGNGDSNRSEAQQQEYNAWVAANIMGQGHVQGYGNQDQQQSRGGNWSNGNGAPTFNWSQEGSKSTGKKRTHESSQWTDGPLDANGEYKGKKKPCTFYSLGKCAKGSKCTFLHE